MISLRELARQNNVSVSTVSRALRDDPSVHVETKRRIQEAAAKLNYTPNRLVEGIFKGRTRLVAVVCSELSFDPISRLISTVIDEINNRNWGCIICNTHNSEQAEADAIHRAVSLRISGMIIQTVNYQASERYYWELSKYKVPYVFTSEYSPDVAAPHVHCDDLIGGAAVMKHLHELGHRNIANLSGPETTWSYGLRHRSYFEGISRYQLPSHPGWVVATDWSTPDARGKTTQLLINHPEITAIFCGNDRIAIGACEAIRKAGLSVPHDISVVGIGDSDICTKFSPPLTSLNQNMDTIGKRSVDVLFQLMDRPEGAVLPRSLIDILVPPLLVVRESTAPPSR